VVSGRPTSSASIEGEPEEPAYIEEEQKETAVSLKDKQVKMEQQVYRIWTYVCPKLPTFFAKLRVHQQCSIGIRGIECRMYFRHVAAG
jgi:hypothetical protein